MKHLNDNQSRIHLQESKDYVKANYELATDLEELIRDFANDGEAKQRFERLGRMPETT